VSDIVLRGISAVCMTYIPSVNALQNKKGSIFILVLTFVCQVLLETGEMFCVRQHCAGGCRLAS